ncbi:MAG TPA: aspartate dehydrogenase domain-containing protein [bacterium]|jgi:aspartate dehydrogenase
MKVAIIGLGAIGGFLLGELAPDTDFEISAICEIDEQKAGKILTALHLPDGLLCEIDEIPDNTDVFVEAASGSVAYKVAELALSRGKIAVIASMGGLGDIDNLVELARRNGGRLLLPSGAIAGLDALKAVPKESIKSVTMKSTKPAGNLADTEYIKSKGLDLNLINEPVKVFDGMARDAAIAFPKSANVAATLALATVGLDNMRVEIWADPFSDRNRHWLQVESGHGRIIANVSNVPFEINPRTSKLAAYSILAAIRNLVNPVVIGT